MYKNLADMYLKAAESFGDRPAFWSKDETKEYRATSFKQLVDLGLSLAEALIDLGVKAREHIGVLADNRLEWIIVDAGVLFTGGANVPRGTDVTDSEMDHILNHSEASVVFVENDKMYEKFVKNKSKLKGVETVIIMDKDSKTKSKGVLHLYDLIEKGKELRSKGGHKAEKRIEAIKPDDLFTLIYTSGTTGMPKGVMLMHSNMIHQMENVVPLILKKSLLRDDDSMLSILPVWHIFERVVEYSAISLGISTFYTKVADLRNDLAKARPSFMASAPRVWESIYTGIYNRINDPKQTPAIRKFLFNTAYFFSKNYNAGLRFLTGKEVDYENRNIFKSLALGIRSIIQVLLTGPFTVSFITGVAYAYVKMYKPELAFLAPVLLTVAILGLIFNFKTLDAVVLAKIRQATGGRLRGTLSGGGALQRHVDNFFNDIGLLVLEGYGMTETGPVISVRHYDHPIIGSVGYVVPKTELQLRDDHGNVLTHINDQKQLLAGKLGVKGIVHIKGPQVMKGYYKNPEVTKKTIVDGWLNTGDIGFINYKYTLTLTGRAKETVVLLGGENVEPVPIENRMDESPYIKQSMVFGQDQKVLGAIIVPDLEVLSPWLKEQGISASELKDIIEHPKVIEFFKKEIREYNSTKQGFKSFELVQHVVIAPKPFEVGDELTNLLKMKRHVITEKYQKRIDKVYK
ncbi:long-chain fatty acid--CoA ligase [Leptospira wolffii]|uniref:AMP-dependent synthetase/ligase n=1 Tax=Leptospira wolffii TaxID=409998 RepID=UPI00034BB9BB|nr:AMP-binding protein [Leptospira wolffii]TGK62010.1 long-chain fatty acid--CoA ligase [Leptospira wolffii]TGK68611.1 long-chain fatty acid--CoA ligase [Leptospira wolffii]TGK74605.1 long-chain fatty acid--CoA ligase [Leptospira wolffii]TGL31819.1 long-chain fatty acid--CoA ligase [Leptospira wolffii]